MDIWTQTLLLILHIVFLIHFPPYYIFTQINIKLLQGLRKIISISLKNNTRQINNNIDLPKVLAFAARHNWFENENNNLYTEYYTSS